MQTHLVWCQEGIWEADWIRDLFGSTDFTEHQAPNLDFFADNSVYVLSPPDLLTQMSKSFSEGLSTIRGKVLFHLSDETFCGGYEFYRHFDAVIRNYYISLLDHPAIMTVPLGYANGQKGSGDLVPASERRAIWGFTGSINADRRTMLAAFRKLQPSHCDVYGNKWGRVQDRRTRQAHAYLAMLADCMFVPCPMGNTTLDTMRPYEALECGAIPIVPRRLLINYFSQLMPNHPLPTFLRWSEARLFAETLSRDKERIDYLQETINRWWISYKATLRKKIAEFVASAQPFGANSQALANWRFHTNYAFQARRMTELIRHSTFRSLNDRVIVATSRIGSRKQHLAT